METIECAVLPSGNIFKMMIQAQLPPCLQFCVCIIKDIIDYYLKMCFCTHPHVSVLRERDSFSQHLCPLPRHVALKQHIQNHVGRGYHVDSCFISKLDPLYTIDA